ncbi:hypothetical protein BX661DRAFT_182923 [Kickxella alabastrina]|uniref:uncharacterized protein n=1 Tax=Kickxella alabastrina TaxID=61397 RepID=UPI002220C94E|nr:uncharacterized protein BX661DRAFT_182923 [Kickxella alabastrina]KAI7827246.1 hypothetical protein BX661DRAFT_182923 [Kickxella alabastrina]
MRENTRLERQGRPQHMRWADHCRRRRPHRMRWTDHCRRRGPHHMRGSMRHGS